HLPFEVVERADVGRLEAAGVVEPAVERHVLVAVGEQLLQPGQLPRLDVLPGKEARLVPDDGGRRSRRHEAHVVPPPRPDQAPGISRGSIPIAMFFSSVYSWRPSRPYWRPRPLWRTPPISLFWKSWA